MPLPARPSGELVALLPTTLATLRADQFSLLHIEAAFADRLPLMEAGAAERFAFGALLLHFAQVDDVGHEVARFWNGGLARPLNASSRT